MGLPSRRGAGGHERAAGGTGVRGRARLIDGEDRNRCGLGAPDRASRGRYLVSHCRQVGAADAAGVGSASHARHLAQKEPSVITGRVKGRYWSTKRVTTLPQGALLDGERETGSHLVALDPLGCGEGELVLIIQGSVAASYFENVRATVDALIVGSLDEEMKQT